MRAAGRLKRGALVALFFLVAAGAGAANLTNDDVIKMAKSGLSEQVLLQVIESNPSQFDTSPAALIALKEAGVPDGVLARMVQVSARRDPAAKGAAAPPPPLSPSPSEVARCANDSLTDVVLIQGQRRTALRRDEGDVREDDQSTLGTLVFVLGMAAQRVIMTFGRSRSDVRIAERSPVFEANRPDGRGEKDFLTIVRLKSEGPARRIEAVKGKNGPVVWNDQAILPEYRLEVTVDFGPSCRTRTSPNPVVPVRTRPAKPLSAGEYAVVRDGAALFTFGVD